MSDLWVSYVFLTCAHGRYNFQHFPLPAQHQHGESNWDPGPAPRQHVLLQSISH